jgi:hypothetical protein
MLAALKTMNRSKLRPIPVRRSIGGTPIREKKEVAIGGGAELLAAIAIRPDSSSDEDSESNA